MIQRLGLRSVVLGALVAATALTGCTATPPPMTAESLKAGDAPYTLGTGDKLHITVFNETQMTGDYTITPAGDISLPLIGNVKAANLTPEQLQQAIAAKLADGYIPDAKVSAEVLTFRDYYILGEVNKPGQYPYSAGLDVQQAVAAAGGYTYRANRGKAFVRRAKGRETTVDLHGDAVGVLPGDTIRVGQRYF